MIKRFLGTAILRSTLTFSLSLLSSSPYRSVSGMIHSLNSRSAFNEVPIAEVTFINASTAQRIDEILMEKPGFSIDQLMELAGLAVASATSDFASSLENKNVLVLCGPGNNGGDGLVAARHLSHFGFNPTVVYPRSSKTNSDLFVNLVKQCADLDIPVLQEIPASSADLNSMSGANSNNSDSSCVSFGLVLDALFGFSFKGPIRPPFNDMIAFLVSCKLPTISIDIPSGWDVENGDIERTGFVPSALISLTLPKLCAAGYKGIHYLGGRFVPAKLAKALEINIPDYGSGSAQVIRLIDKPPSLSVLPSLEERIVEIHVTAGSQEEAEHIANGLLEQNLVACVNIVSGVTSVYRWKGEIQRSSEVLMVMKSRSSLIPLLTTKVHQLHSYETPEVIAFEVSGGSNKYQTWVRDSTITNK